jgi:hypothetical protein
MTTELVLNLDSDVVDFANNLSQSSHQTVSSIVENYFLELKRNNAQALSLPKDLDEIYGIFDGIDAPDKKEMRKMFHEKNND